MQPVVHPAASSSSGPPASASSPAASPSAAAPLEAAKAANTAQQLMCNDPQLTDLDRRLQTAYRQALARPGADQAAR